MKVTFITNACAIYESSGFRLVSDPWLTNGAFEGSWFHYPPVRTTPEELARMTDALYISHIHPDHFDPVSLVPMRKDVPVVILDHAGSNFLRKRLQQLDFTNIVAVRDNESATVGPYRMTLFAPFDVHNFFDAKVGNLIDSGLLIDDGVTKVLNCNDNVPQPDSAAKVVQKHGPIDLLQLQYCAAGPYPSCFMNLSDEMRNQACEEVRERYLRLFVNNVKAVRPRFTMPFAGDFVLGGSQWKKNSVLGTLPAILAAERLRQDCPEHLAVMLGEGMTIDVVTGEVTGGEYHPFHSDTALAYIERELAQILYPHEIEHTDAAQLSAFLTAALPRARHNFGTWQQHFGYSNDINVYLELGDGRLFHFNPAMFETEFVDDATMLMQPYLKCTMDPRLLFRILTRDAKWNNAEGGCHIDFHRVPDVYDPDLHTMLSFLHIVPT